MRYFLHVLLLCATYLLSAGETLLDWVGKQSIRYPIDLQKEVPLLGRVSIEGISCSNFKMQSFSAQDGQSALAPGSFILDITLEGISTHCIAFATEESSNGTLVFDQIVTIPTMRLTVQANPVDFPVLKGSLPLGPIDLVCNLDLQLQALSISGSSPHVDLLRDMTSGPLSGAGMAVMELAVANEMCNMLRQNLPDTGSMRAQLEPWLSQEQRPVVEASVVNWGIYPPFQFFSLLLREELPNLLELVLNNRPSMLKFKLLTADVNIESLQIDDLSLSNQSHVQLRGHLDEMGTQASIQSLRTVSSITMTIQPLTDLFEHMVTAGDASRDVAPYIKKYQVNSNLRNFHMHTGLSAMISPKLLGSLAIDQMQLWGCLFSCAPDNGISLLNFSSNFMDANELSISRLVDPIEVGAWSIVKAVIKAVGSYNSEDVNALIRGAANAYLYRLRNNLDDCGESKLDHGVPILSFTFLVVSMATMFFGIAVSLCVISRKGFHSELELAPSAPPRCNPRTGDSIERHVSGESEEILIHHISRLDVKLDSQRSQSEATVSDDDVSWRHDGGPLCSHHVVPHFERALIPFGLLSTLCAFLYSYFAIGTEVVALFVADGNTEEIGPVFALSLIMSIRDAWDAGAYFIAVLVGVLCAVWPLAKLALLGVAWTLPEARLSVRARGRLLYFLDVAGSVSLIDTWLGILIVAAFSYEYDSVLEPDTTMRIQVIPKLPFFVFVLATVASLSIGHYISELDLRTSLWSALKWDWEAYVAAYPISSLTIFKLCARKLRPTQVDPYQWPALKDVYPVRACLVVPGLILFIVFTIAGVSLNSFDLVVWGFIPEMLFEDSEARFSFSVLSVGWSVADANNPLNRGLRFFYACSLIVVVLLFVVILPLGCAFSLLLLWAFPMMAHRQQRALRMGHIFDAWSCLDLFALAIVLMWSQLDQIANQLQYHSNLAVLCNRVKGFTGRECIGTSCELTVWFPVLAVAGALSFAMPKAALYGIEEEMYDRHHSLEDSRSVSFTGAWLTSTCDPDTEPSGEIFDESY